MSTHSVAEAKNQLSDLIDRAIAGEDVVITRHGRPVIALKSIERHIGPISIADLDWLAARRIETRRGAEDAGTLVSRMRDDDER